MGEVKGPRGLRKLSSAHKGGYVTVGIWDGKRSHPVYVHIMVLEAFVGPCPPGMECRHLNGNPADNRLANLEWGTPTQNNLDQVVHGTHPHASKTQCSRGHDLVGENIIWGKSRIGNPRRQCRLCYRHYRPKARQKKVMV